MTVLTIKTDFDLRVEQANPTSAFGTATLHSMSGDTAASLRNRTLLRFSLTTLPAGAHIRAVKFGMYINGVPSTNTTYDFYDMLTNYDVVEAAATFNTKDGVNAWAGGANGGGVHGTDISSTIRTTISVASTDIADSVHEGDFDVAFLQSVSIGTAQNHDRKLWIVGTRTGSGTGTIVGFRARESTAGGGAGNEAPYLTITYDLFPAAVGSVGNALTGVGSVGNALTGAGSVGNAFTAAGSEGNAVTAVGSVGNAFTAVGSE